MPNIHARPSLDQLRKQAKELLAQYRSGDPAAQSRSAAVIPAPPIRPYSLADAQFVIAREHNFPTWAALKKHVESLTQPLIHGLSATPPFYRIRPKESSLEPRAQLSPNDWEELFAIMQHRGITSLHAAGQMTDAILQRLGQLNLLTSLNLEGSSRVTDEGMAHIAAMSSLQSLNLIGCSITDHGLAAIAHLSDLRSFSLLHHHGISDAGLAHLAHCHLIEKVDLLNTSTGDGVLRALTNKPNLRLFKSGNQLTDSGLTLLHQLPVFKQWHGGHSDLSLMSFSVEPNLLLLRGQLTDRGMANLTGLDGLFSLNLDDNVFNSDIGITAAGVRHLAALPHLAMLGFDASDTTMPAIAALPHLRMLMCQDTKATGAGFQSLSRSTTLEYIWGRRCYNLDGPGFTALSRIPSLRGLAASCKNVPDAALASLPDFPGLAEFMPMDIPDAGFRHIARCPRIEDLWCMYCRDTTDAATEHIATLPRLKTYYAGRTQITDRSLELLSRISTLERIILSACAGVTNTGIAHLATLPHLHELGLEQMPAVTREALATIPTRVMVNFET